MLTSRTSAYIPTSQHCRSFRLIPTSTGVLWTRAGARRLFQEWTRLWNAELRRLWLDDRWSAHVRRVQSSQSRRQA
jgi:hypothetical protein